MRVDPGSTVKAIVTVEVERSLIEKPAKTDKLFIPRLITPDLRKYMGVSPFIETTNPKIVEVSRGLGDDGKNAWQRVADAVGSRTAKQCKEQYRDLKKAGRLDRISEDTPLRAGIFPGFGKPAFNKFDKCVAKIDGKRITTVGQLAKLPVDNYGPNLSYLKELTGLKDNAAFKKALAWKAMAVEAIEFWQ